MNIQELSMHPEILHRYFKGKGWYRIALLTEQTQEQGLRQIIEADKTLQLVSTEGETSRADVLIYMQKTAAEKPGILLKPACPMLTVFELFRRCGICLECLAYPDNGLERALLEKQERLGKKGVLCLDFVFPALKEIKPLTKKEQLLLEKSADSINRKTIAEQPEFYKSFFDKYQESEIAELFPTEMGIVQRGNLKYLSDYRGKFVNIIQGYRYTTDAPESFKNSVYLFGKSQVYGYGCEDGDTIASCLQRLLNKQDPMRYLVLNRAVSAVSDAECLLHFKEEEMRPGDIVIYIHMKRRCFHSFCCPPRSWEELSDAFLMERREADMFLDSIPHFNYRANERISDLLFERIQERLAEQKTGFCAAERKTGFDAAEQKTGMPDFGRLERVRLKDYDEEQELQEYLQKIRKFRKQGGKNGAIVMNCNPFTLGHRYLIETAAKEVSWLYVLVVEENKSRFSFEDRLRLVQEGTKDLENVTVLPGGGFVISSLTFPEYFQKEKEKDIKIDPSLDVELFASYIAPALEIQVRFAGEEPIDLVTRQYNETMARLLPRYGIAFCEVKRKKSGAQVISASRVRGLLEERRYQELKELVPETTYRYLKRESAKEGETI